MRLLGTIFTRGRLWMVVKHDFIGVRVHHHDPMTGQGFTEWPVLRRDGSIVFPAYSPTFRARHISCKNSESTAVAVPSKVVEVVRRNLGA